MPLPSSGEIKLSQIRDEFGLAAGQIAMSSLYSKGNAPASGEIQIGADFHGTAGSLVAGSITRGGLEDKTGRYIVGRHESTPSSSANIGSISYSTTETFSTRFFADLGLAGAVVIKPNNATTYTKVDKITIGGRTYTRRRSSNAVPDSTVGEMHFASNYQSNYNNSPSTLAEAYAGSPFTSSSAMSFTAEEDRSFFCDTSFTSGSPATQSSTDTKFNTSQRRDYRGFQISTNSNLKSDSQTFGTQSSISLTNPDYSSGTATMAGFFVKRIRNYNGTTFSGTPTTQYLLYVILTASSLTAPHPSHNDAGSIATSNGPWSGYNGLKRFEITVGSTTHYYPFGANRASLLGGTVSNMGFRDNGDAVYAMKDTSNNVNDVGVAVWNHIGSGNTVNIKLY